MSRTKILTQALVALVLAAGLGMVALSARPRAPRTFTGSITDLLPTEAHLDGWTVEYQPIAETPEMKKAVSELLNYDDAVFAIYRKGAMRLAVYVAYWAPGRMSHRLVAGHTPDVCWVGNGWRVEEARRGVQLPDGRGGALPPGEERTMMQRGQLEHVVFWHFLDGKPKSYGTQGMPPWHAVFTDIFDHRLNQQPEQFFIRISSNIRPEQWADLLPLQWFGSILQQPAAGQSRRL